MPYPTEALVTRAIIKHGVFALIPPTGLVNNVVPGFENCVISIVASPKMGASFVHYTATVHPGGVCRGFGGDGVETFVHVISGQLKAKAGEEAHTLTSGGYLFVPSDKVMTFVNDSQQDASIILYKQRFVPLPIAGKKPWVVAGNVNDIAEREYDGMHNVFVQDLLPVDIAFDMNMHILSFEPAGCHPFVETHVQEHGAHILSGEGLYNLDNNWYPVKKDDYLWFGPYVPQAVYATGRERLAYIYSKDCHRDAAI